jgi:hypothetical protein
MMYGDNIQKECLDVANECCYVGRIDAMEGTGRGAGGVSVVT